MSAPQERPKTKTPAFSSTTAVVGLGEALFDCFDEREVVGGAPVNLAVHANALLQEVGGGALPATAVGNDERGRRFCAELADRGVADRGVQVSSGWPTGTVRVRIGPEGNAEYVFEPKVAWDQLEWTPDWEKLANSCHAVAFGTLAQRTRESRVTIHRFVRSAINAIRFFDVNLRGNFYDAEVISDSLNLANAAKLNEHEIVEVTDLLDLGGADEDDRAKRLAEAFSLEWLAITRGPKGTLLFRDNHRYEAAESTNVDPSLRSPNADSVGAGDACSAALLTGSLLGWSDQQILSLANRVGAYVAGQPGATPRLPRFLLDSIEPAN